MADKITSCKTCGAEMAASAKVCPKCGAKNKKPFYKKWWFWVLAVIIIAGIAGGASNSGNTASSGGTAPALSAAQSGEPGGRQRPADGGHRLHALRRGRSV